VVTLDVDGARRRAAEAGQALARGEVWGPLHGVGVTVVARLKAAGAIIVGKTNGPCIWGEDSLFPPTLNPWNAERTVGGSSTRVWLGIKDRSQPGNCGELTIEETLTTQWKTVALPLPLFSNVDLRLTCPAGGVYQERSFSSPQGYLGLQRRLAQRSSRDDSRHSGSVA
jgi:hypothetical protein